MGDGEVEGGFDSACYGGVGGGLDGGAEEVLFRAGKAKGGLDTKQQAMIL